MVQAKLPDLNNYWIKYHDSGMFNIMRANYQASIASIYSMNALLPDEYRLSVDTSKYTELTHSILIAVCSHCNTQTPRTEIKVFDLIVPLVFQVVRETKTIEVWYCSKCKESNELVNTKYIQNENAQPFYYKVIPEPPIISDGLNRRDKGRSVTTWFYNALEELDHQLGLYRKEYEPEGERDDVTEFEEE